MFYTTNSARRPVKEPAIRRFLAIEMTCLLLLFSVIVLTSCSLVKISCNGKNVTCSSGAPTPTANVPVVMATVHAITQSVPLLSDSLNQPDGTWADHPGTCFFQNGSYTVEGSQSNNGDYPTRGCDAQKTSFGDAAVQMDVTLISGDAAGILFRVDDYFSQMYYFAITPNKKAEFLLFGPDPGATTFLMGLTSSSAIKGPDQTNTLLLVARGNFFQLFVNGTLVGEARDSSTLSGHIGMAVSDETQNAQASFSNVVVYPV